LANAEIVDLINRRLDEAFPWLVDSNGHVVENQAIAPDGRTFKIRCSANNPDLIGKVYILEDTTLYDTLERVEKKYREGTAKSLLETIDTLTRVLESIDPYTVMHCRNVANLAKKIATQIGLNSTEAQGIFLGARVHDIGKLTVPMSILNKPGKLVQAELNLIQLHCESGYALVKDLEFPWPVHTIISQHHERFDGSGYPAGLSGSNIDLSARIVAVADVVDAMSSHRPYRAALGIDVALEEIVAGRGVKYDPDIVDACVDVLTASGDCSLASNETWTE
jgi:putative nucleotidyltransferase with HDIG domain